jgi:hypothetical protein
MPTPRPPTSQVGTARLEYVGRRTIGTGQTSIQGELRLATQGVDQSACVLTHDILPDKPWVAISDERLAPEPSQTLRLIDARHTFDVWCPASDGVATSKIQIRVVDGQPERCLGVSFDGGPVTADTFQELRAGMIGSWRGCVDTPWTPTYQVDIEFRRDGTYRATGGESLDGQHMTALYYGSDRASREKRYALLDMQDSGRGLGQIDLWWRPGDTNRGELRNIRLMGDVLTFEVFHGESGPITFWLQHR